MRDGRLVVRVPAGLATSEEERLTAALLDRLRRRASSVPAPVPGLPDAVVRRRTDHATGPRGHPWLVGLADEVGDRWLDGERAAWAAWSSRMTTRWGSCTVQTRRLRISDRLADAPEVVVAHVLLHELAHLRERGHGPAFAALLGRDPAAAAVDRWLVRREVLETARALEREGLLGPP